MRWTGLRTGFGGGAEGTFGAVGAGGRKAERYQGLTRKQPVWIASGFGMESVLRLKRSGYCINLRDRRAARRAIRPTGDGWAGCDHCD